MKTLPFLPFVEHGIGEETILDELVDGVPRVFKGRNQIIPKVPASADISRFSNRDGRVECADQIEVIHMVLNEFGTVGVRSCSRGISF
jgi:hypothetical protein